MPKKLAELLKAGDALQTEYEALMSTLRSCAQSGTQHEQMISEGLDARDNRINVFLKHGITGKLVSDFVRDPDAKSLATEIETQKAAYIKKPDYP